MNWTTEDDHEVRNELISRYIWSQQYAEKIGFPVEWLAKPPRAFIARPRAWGAATTRGRRLDPERSRGRGKRSYRV